MTLFYSAERAGFFDDEINVLPADAVEISAHVHEQLLAGQSAGFVISAGEDGRPILTERPQPGPPTVVSMRQARLALLDAGFLDQVDTAIASLPSPQKEAAQIEWEYATEVRRESTTMILIGAALGLSEVQVGDLFIAAAAKG